MGELKNLSDKEGIKKIKELVEDIDICMFCTQVETLPFESRPMSTADIDQDGNLWFFSQKDSNKDYEVKQDDKVQLIYAKSSESKFLTVTGTAHAVNDSRKVDELWSPILKAWFPGGKDDPNLSLLKVVPEEAYYWDTQHGKMISFFKIAAAAVTGNQKDDSVEGRIIV